MSIYIFTHTYIYIFTTIIYSYAMCKLMCKSTNMNEHIVQGPEIPRGLLKMLHILWIKKNHAKSQTSETSVRKSSSRIMAQSQ